MSNETQLVKYQESLVQELSPFEATSNELLAKAESQNITTELQLVSAVAIKKQITTHRKLVSDTRLDITRRFDQVKKAIINRENEILLPLDKAQSVLGDKILTYQEEQERIRREEEERVNALVKQVTRENVYDLKTPEAVDTVGKSIKDVYTSFDSDDQKNARVKLAFTEAINRLATRRTSLEEEERQRIERERLAEEAEKQSEERQKVEAEKAAVAEKERKVQAEKERLEREKERREAEVKAEEDRKQREAEERNRVKTGVRTVTTFEVTDPDLVPRDLCMPNDALIRSAIKEGREVPGVKVITTRKI